MSEAIVGTLRASCLILDKFHRELDHAANKGLLKHYTKNVMNRIEDFPGGQKFCAEIEGVIQFAPTDMNKLQQVISHIQNKYGSCFTQMQVARNAHCESKYFLDPHDYNTRQYAGNLVQLEYTWKVYYQT